MWEIGRIFFPNPKAELSELELEALCNLASYDNFSSLSSFKKFLRATYFTLLNTTYDINMPCTWFLSRNCPCHRSYILDFFSVFN